MTKTRKITALVVFTVIVIPILSITFCVFRAKQFNQNFSRIGSGQTKQTVINLMGEPSEIQNCNFPIYDFDKNYIGNCAEKITYDSPFEKRAFAFDKEGKLVEKYYWFLGEYGNRPPDLN